MLFLQNEQALGLTVDRMDGLLAKMGIKSPPPAIICARQAWNLRMERFMKADERNPLGSTLHGNAARVDAPDEEESALLERKISSPQMDVSDHPVLVAIRKLIVGGGFASGLDTGAVKA